MSERQSKYYSNGQPELKEARRNLATALARLVDLRVERDGISWHAALTAVLAEQPNMMAQWQQGLYR